MKFLGLKLEKDIDMKILTRMKRENTSLKMNKGLLKKSEESSLPRLS